ncbi:mpv17-like protein 2 [Drosophila ficusphila]|uniref:mpv17-like protein 2 n=1 Tax=Drosophila ficusphila TaxID=30025 RepID=UPI0007E683DA|nr:mpv17-like protein 2 [Drosophila ficusphila]
MRMVGCICLIPQKMFLNLDNYSTMNSGIPPKPKFWSKLFGKYLMLTNTVGSGVLLPIGDAVAQQYERMGDKKPFDFSRSGCMMVTGLVIGPVQHGFYLLLDRLLPGTNRSGIVRKLLADQLIMSPIYISMFFYISGLLEGGSIRECNDEMSEKFLYTWLADMCFWPGLQYFNFRYLKSFYRVAFVNLANCAYIVLLSHIKHSQSGIWP